MYIIVMANFDYKIKYKQIWSRDIQAKMGLISVSTCFCYPLEIPIYSLVEIFF